MKIIADMLAQCRIYQDNEWKDLGECRLRLTHDSISIEVHAPAGPFCIDSAFSELNAELEQSAVGPVLYLVWRGSNREVALEVRGPELQLDRFYAAVLSLE
ncbi:MAG: hypothetical protein ACP6IT_06375 [Candidatus Thorarchaeota archaeon]